MIFIDATTNIETVRLARPADPFYSPLGLWRKNYCAIDELLAPDY
jgi:hypothetical protein